MHSHEIRKKFFDFFIKHNHTAVASSSLIPAQDPTLLFANAGMNQFKDVFLGKETRSYSRAVSIQKCIRAGGKHNDLENVGFTKRHLTFFEMMGNFSFGDYFKKEAIIFAWEFLTREIGLPVEKLYASVYKLDNEAYDIWKTTIGLPIERIVRLGEADNFWQMGDTGPCGPCSEIYIDRGIDGCGEKSCAPGCSCDRFLEIWNLVFMQFDRQSDGSDKPLKQIGVDTGMGLERLCAAMQNIDSVFETDIFMPLIEHTQKLSGIVYDQAPQDIQAAFRVLADHIRSACFAIADGCTPSNEGRGYVLRKIIRRAALFSQKLSSETIFPALAPALIEQMKTIYPALKSQEKQIIALLKSETEKFAQNLLSGQNILATYFEHNKNSKVISGTQAFKLYDTYGFPLELTKVISYEHGFTVDSDSFEKEMEQQRLQSGKKTKEYQHCDIDDSIATTFTGYDEHKTDTTIIGLLVDNVLMQEVSAGQLCTIITKSSPFYVECGGQISDQGFVHIKDNSGLIYQAKLLGVKKLNNAIGSLIQAPTLLRIGDNITLEVDSPTRIKTMKNHTATHLLQAALIQVVGNTIKQSGSVVTPDYLRFDFTHHENLSLEQIKLVEDIVNNKITENIPLQVTTTTLKEATSRGVIAFFGEKYNPEEVRVVEIPGFSAELCGGTHVTATGDIGVFKIIEVSALSAGNRRLVALTGPAAISTFQSTFNIVKSLAQEFKATPETLGEAIKKQRDQLKSATISNKELKKKLVRYQLPEWIAHNITIGSLPFGYIILESEADELKDIALELQRFKSGFYFLVTQHNQRAHFFASLAPAFNQTLDFKALAAWLKTQGLQGGGSGATLQGSTAKLPHNFKQQLIDWLQEHN